MAATPDRTTVKKAIQELVLALRTNLVADPLTVSKPFRRVDEGPPAASQYPRPFLSVWLTKAEPTALTEGEKITGQSFFINKAELTHCVFNDLRVTRDHRPIQEVANLVIANRAERLSYDYQGDVIRYAG
ncbi:MAG: hypothetical protein IIB32_01915, partial [Chloroflexi bacterium]|nr:hypothetical protein [Chloroflexota bacterium]